MGVSIIYFLFLCVDFICLQAVYQLSGPVCAKSTWRYSSFFHMNCQICKPYTQAARDSIVLD